MARRHRLDQPWSAISTSRIPPYPYVSHIASLNCKRAQAEREHKAWKRVELAESGTRLPPFGLLNLEGTPSAPRTV